MVFNFRVCLCLIALFPSVSLAALFSKKNSQTRGPALLEWDPSVRAEGMGGAYVGLADDAGALYWNPAGMGQAPRSELAFGYADEFGEQTGGDLRFLRPVWWGKERRTWGLRAAYSTVKPFELTEDGESGGTVHPQDFVLGVSYEQPLGPVFVGGTLKGIRQDISVDSASTWATDLGVLGKGKRFQWGVSLLNLGPALQTSRRSVDLPIHLLGGGAWNVIDRHRPGFRDKVLAVFQLDAPISDSPSPQVGMEVSRQWENRTEIAGRMGYRSLPGDPNFMDKMTFGLGFARDPFGINYAYLSQDDLGATHRFEVTWRFGPPLEQEQWRDKLLAEAEVLYSESRMMRARATLNEVLAISPNNQKANRLQKKIDARIATSMDPETLFILGEQAFNEGRYEQSADLFKRLTEVDPKYPEAAERLEKADVKAGEIRLREAEARLKEERMKEQRARQARAKKLTTEKKWREAIEAWEKVLELTPGDGDAKRALARCQEEAHLMDMKGKEEAKQLYEKGMIVYSEKDFEKARWYFEQALKANPNDKKAAKALEHIIEEGKYLP